MEVTGAVLLWPVSSVTCHIIFLSVLWIVSIVHLKFMFSFKVSLWVKGNTENEGDYNVSDNYSGILAASIFVCLSTSVLWD